MTIPSNQKRLCPSAKCETGSSLLGIVNGEGKIDYLQTPVEISDSFVRVAHEGRSPEKRFRFTASCIEDGCKQWVEGRCTVADKVIAAIHSEIHDKPLPNCGIRASCRWFKQSGQTACAVCEHVVTDTMVD